MDKTISKYLLSISQIITATSNNKAIFKSIKLQYDEAFFNSMLCLFPLVRTTVNHIDLLIDHEDYQTLVDYANDYNIDLHKCLIDIQSIIISSFIKQLRKK